MEFADGEVWLGISSHGMRFAMTYGGANSQPGVSGFLIRFERHCPPALAHAAVAAVTLENEPVSRGGSR